MTSHENRELQLTWTLTSHPYRAGWNPRLWPSAPGVLSGFAGCPPFLILAQPENIRFPQDGSFRHVTITILLFPVINLRGRKTFQCKFLGQKHSTVPWSQEQSPKIMEFKNNCNLYNFWLILKITGWQLSFYCPFIQKGEMKTYACIRKALSTIKDKCFKKSRIVIYLSNKDNSPVSQSCNLQLHLFVGVHWRNLSPVQHEAIVLSNVLHGLGKLRFYWASRREFFQDFK